MKRNGFTLIELLAVIMILGIILLIAVPAVDKYILRTEDTYYDNLEKTIRSTVIDYTADNRSFLPKNVGTILTVDKKELIDNKYIESVVDTSNNDCEAHAVVQKITKVEYDYVVCLTCAKYKTENQLCQYTMADNDDYKIQNETDFNIAQGDRNYKLPKAEVVLLGITIGYLEPTMEESFDVDVLGDYNGTYTYQGVTAPIIVHVIDEVNPKIPDVEVQYSDGSTYNGVSNKTIKIDMSSSDLTENGLQGSGVKEFLISYDEGANWISVSATNEKATITKTGNFDLLWVKAKDNSGNESEIRKLATATFVDYSGTTKSTNKILSYLENDKVNIVTPMIQTYTGHTIVGWTNEASGFTKKYDQNVDLYLAPTTYYAVYGDHTLTISYNSNGGSAIASSTHKTLFNSSGVSKSVSTKLSRTKPTKTGHTFNHWANGSVKYQPGASVTITSNLTVKASWTVNTYTIKYDANGGSGAPSNQTKTYNVTLKLSETKPTRTGYTFLGWSTSKTATTATYQAGANFTGNSNTTLYAVWQATNKVIYSSTTGINLFGAIGSWTKSTWAKNGSKTTFEIDSSKAIHVRGKCGDGYGGGITVTSPSFSTAGFSYICIQAKIGQYSNNVTIKATGSSVANNFNGTKCFSLNGKTSTAITMTAYSDYGSKGATSCKDRYKGEARLYKVVLTNNSSLDLSEY